MTTWPDTPLDTAGPLLRSFGFNALMHMMHMMPQQYIIRFDGPLLPPDSDFWMGRTAILVIINIVLFESISTLEFGLI